MMESLAQRIEDHIYLQSLSIQNLKHCFDLIETLDIITPSKDFRIRDVRGNCLKFITTELTDLQEFDWSLKRSKNLSFANVTMLRGILLTNLWKQWKPKEDDKDAGEAKKDACKLAKDLQKGGTLLVDNDLPGYSEPDSDSD